MDRVHLPCVTQSRAVLFPLLLGPLLFVAAAHAAICSRAFAALLFELFLRRRGCRLFRRRNQLILSAICGGRRCRLQRLSARPLVVVGGAGRW